MTIKKRYLHQAITQDLSEKMVFIVGPRQVGKTTLAEFIGDTEYKKAMYLNWDNQEDRKNILKGSFAGGSDLLIFDEIHKYKKWKNHMKGIYDIYKKHFAILVTGSARFDLYRKGGDSLQGRYHSYRLHPFSISELVSPDSKKKKYPPPFRELHFDDREHQDHFDTLFQFGGFPEPLFHQTEKALRRWHSERMDRIIKEDIRDIELVRDISALQILGDLLPEKAGGRLSLNALREDLEVTHKTISLWVDVLERFYYHFRIYPFAAHTIKSLRKEPKLYLWDWSPLTLPGRKLENMIASHLLKFVHFLYDAEGYKTELFYLRDHAGREVDFLVTANKKPWFAVEVKTTNLENSQHLTYFGERLQIPFLYHVVGTSNIDIMRNNIRTISASRFLSSLV